MPSKHNIRSVFFFVLFFFLRTLRAFDRENIVRYFTQIHHQEKTINLTVTIQMHGRAFQVSSNLISSLLLLLL